MYLQINELNQLLRDQNRTQERQYLSDDEVSPVDTQQAPDPESILGYVERGKAPWSSVTDGFDDRSALFTFGDSPASQDKAVELDTLENVPTKRQSDILYRGFMSGVHAISPVLHPPSILEKYQSFWVWYDQRNNLGDPYDDPSFIPLLYAIWYGGSVTIPARTIKSEFDIDYRGDLSSLFHDEVTRWLRRISFPKSPSLHGLTAFLIVQTILSKEEEPLASSLFISLALRVAQTMGLHRDPAQFGISGSTAETRRRLWWHIVHMDGVVAMSSGLPPLVSDENYWDVRMTSEAKDTLLGTQKAGEYDRLVNRSLREPDRPDDPSVCGGPSVVNVYYLCAKGKYTMARQFHLISFVARIDR